MNALDARDLTRRFGGILALEAVTISLRQAEIAAVVGPNGAGKTTLFDCLLGAMRPDAGTVTLNGRDVTRLPVHARARLGMSRTFQRVELFGELTVRQHLLVADRARRRVRGLLADLTNRSAVARDETQRVDALLTLLGLERDADRQAQTLPLGRARLVELGRALATEPAVVLADEPSSGLDDAERHTLVAALRSVRDRGTSVLLVEHDLEVVRSVAARVYVLAAGSVVAAGDTAPTLADEAVVRAYRAGLRER